MRAHFQLPASDAPCGAPPPPSPGRWRLATSWAASESDVRAAQRLRFAIFAGELGACLAPPQDGEAGCDVDRFDDFCDHLLVHIVDPLGEASPQLVGTYRMLSPDGARRAGGYYSDSEFDLTPLRALRSSAVELGRACVDPAWRNGGVIMALWSELGSYMLRHRLDTMFGCASIGMADGGAQARSIWRHVSDQYLAAPQFQVTPAMPVERIEDSGGAVTGLRDLPPLLKGYLRCGAKVLGPPSLDPFFNTADLPVMLRLDDLSERYRKQFLRAQ